MTELALAHNDTTASDPLVRFPAPRIEPLMDAVRGEMEAVNETILARTGSDVKLIPELANHLIDSGGKRLRPLVTLAASKIYGYEGDHHVILAAAVEFMHTATLLHDDVVDESHLRRGKPAARMIWGNQASVLVGDFLLGQAFQMMVGTGSLAALDVLSRASAIIAEGEVMQLVTAQNLDTRIDNYMRVIDAKTAALFSAAAEVGPIVAGADDTARDTMRDFGRALGVAFQLVDDALDYSGNQAALGKNVGDDLREGKVTMPVILAHEDGTAEERAFWTRCIVERDIRDGDLDHAMTLMDRYGTVARTLEAARGHAGRAIDLLAGVPQGPMTDALAESAAFSVARAN